MRFVLLKTAILSISPSTNPKQDSPRHAPFAMKSLKFPAAIKINRHTCCLKKIQSDLNPPTAFLSPGLPRHSPPAAAAPSAPLCFVEAWQRETFDELSCYLLAWAAA
jgi:hypothetical protein